MNETVLAALEASSINNQCREQLSPAETARYSTLRDRQLQIYIVVNLHDNALILPDFIIQLYKLLQFLDGRRVYVSVYESSSSDQSRTHLILLDRLLDTMPLLGHTIQMGSDHLEPNQHRIDFLASVRNKALEPLNELKQEAPVKFNKVIFMNDVLYCHSDVLELLFQSVEQQSDITCGLDFDSDQRGLGYYDTWVGRDVNGEQLAKRPLWQHTSDSESNSRLSDVLPVQMMCCWNGMVVLNAEPFMLDEPVRFRRDLSQRVSSTAEYNKYMPDKDRGQIPLYKACSESEISTLCKDFRQRGFDKVVVVPRVRFAYDLSVYQEMHSKFPVDHDIFAAAEVEKVEYKPLANVMKCQPMDGNGVRDPDGEVGWQVVD